MCEQVSVAWRPVCGGVGGWATAAEELTPFLRGLRRCPLSNKHRQSTYYAPGTVASGSSMSVLTATHTVQLLLNVAPRAALGSGHGPSPELEYQPLECEAQRQRSQKQSPDKAPGTSGEEGLSFDVLI